MGNFDWSEEQLARHWAESFESLERMEREGVLPRGEPSALADGVLRTMNGALLKVSEVLEAQSRLRRDLAALREEHALALRASRESEARKDARIAALEGEVRTLRAALAGPRGACVALPVPPDAHLNQPLVIRSGGEQYLGVCDRGGQALSVCDFLRIIEGAEERRLVGTSWAPADDGWVLNIGLTWADGGAVAYSLETASIRTPSGNVVTLLRDMAVDGRPVPRGYLMRMFRKLRDGVQD